MECLITTKTCNQCKATKALSDFKPRGDRKGYRPECRECSRVVLQRINLRRYGITLEEFRELVKSQGYRCAICGASDAGDVGRNLNVDHCHSSGKVRGALCGFCNRGIGMFRDNPELLAAAIGYLRQNAA